MASHRVEETEPSSHHLPYNLYGIHNNNPPSTLINQDGPAFDFGELEQAIVVQGQAFSSGRPAMTLEMFPSWPIKFQQTLTGISLRWGEGGGEERSDESGSGVDAHTIPMSKKASSSSSSSSSGRHHDQSSFQKNLQLQTQITQLTDGLSPHHHHSPQQKRKGCGSTSTSHKQLDAKTLRRLAQNREAARKSRLRKKAYVQQLESSRIKLTQLEQDLQRARSQGLFLGAAGANLTSGAAMFDMEYARWLEDDHRNTAELRAALDTHLPDGDLRVMVDACVCHYDEIFRLKGEAAKSDVFHLITGMWMTPAERCFVWIGGYRPSDLMKMLLSQLEPITEQQLMEIYKLQHSSQQAEDALSQGLDQLHHSLMETVAGAPVIDGINQMILAIHKLSNLQGFLHQADILRQQILHQLQKILTIRQAARCFWVIGEYNNRLRGLSSLWSSRPKEQDQ
ncbi:transcription factor TGA9-like isoform X2 [Momordica charantia]|uniref:Transcription factor TGA9-like isoform X2 n=1 Tax=Momordica charantia TaxID=3673 RepID=A0A6J1DJB5_MOMCH|nr:transcription factor TGA9-like isoform X2 [Momordica charantia]